MKKLDSYSRKWGGVLSAGVVVCLCAALPAAAQPQTGGGGVGQENYKTTDGVSSITDMDGLRRIDDSGQTFGPSLQRAPAAVTFCGEFWSPVGAGVALTLVLDRAGATPDPSEYVFPAGVVLDSGLDVNPETKCFVWGANQLARQVNHKFEVFWEVVGNGAIFVGKRTITVISGAK
jgi:hypothetical protein